MSEQPPTHPPDQEPTAQHTCPPLPSRQQGALPPGSILAGRYHLVELLGRGGMGEVYLARDDKLGRQVAVKLVRGDLLADPECLARLGREARLLAALNHTHIAQLYGLEEDGGLHFLVMELVPGPTLADRLEKGRPSIEESIGLAIQLAEALEAAHAQGIVHRDLKPANLKVTPLGVLKVLDFGLAQQRARGAAAHEPTLTREGTVMGTPAYMSPEQASGDSVDSRADVWAFGCVLFEMLSGRPAFPGKSASDVLAAVLRGELDWAPFPSALPPRLRLLVERCLRRDQRRRLHHIADARIELQDADSLSTAFPATGPPPTRRTALLALAGLGLVAGGVAAGRWLFGRAAAPSAGQPEWTGDLLLSGPGGPHEPALSPDGRWLAFLLFVDRQTQVALMDLGSGEQRLLTRDRTQGPAEQLCWALDGTRLYFTRVGFSGTGDVWSVSSNGGREQKVLDRANNPQPLPDGSLLAGRLDDDGTYRLLRHWPGSGRVELLPTPIAESTAGFWSFRAFPDGREAVCWEAVSPGTAPRLCALHLETGKGRTLDDRPRPVSHPSLAVSHDGREVYVGYPGAGAQSTQVIAVPRAGGSRRVLLNLPDSCMGLSAGSDGSLILGVVSPRSDLLRFSTSGGVPERLAWAGHGWETPLQLPDGRILFGENVSGRHRVVAFQQGKGTSPFVLVEEETWLPAALLSRTEVVLQIGPHDRRDLAVVSLEDGRIRKRYRIAWPRQLASLTAAPNGATLWFPGEGSIWALDRDSTRPRKTGPGRQAALSADGRFLYVARPGKTAMRLVRRPIVGGPDQPLAFPATLRPHEFLLTGSAAGPGGQVAVLANVPDCYFNVPAILDTGSSEVRPIRLDYEGDIFYPGWADGGKMLALGFAWQSALWRFRPVQGPASR